MIPNPNETNASPIQNVPIYDSVLGISIGLSLYICLNWKPMIKNTSPVRISVAIVIYLNIFMFETILHYMKEIYVRYTLKNAV